MQNNSRQMPTEPKEELLHNILLEPVAYAVTVNASDKAQLVKSRWKASGNHC